jgi:hypothetical protein
MPARVLQTQQSECVNSSSIRLFAGTTKKIELVEAVILDLEGAGEKAGTTD